MKKSILFLLATALLIGGTLAARSFTRDTSNDLFEANVEALSQGEIEPLQSCFREVSITYDPILNVRVKKCDNCSYVFVSEAFSPFYCL